MSINRENLERQNEIDQKQLRRLKWVVAIVFLIGAAAAVFMPLVVTSWSWIPLSISEPNTIGDAVGGIMGPTVGLIAAFLTFLAFYAQIQANTDQRHQFRLSLLQQEEALDRQTVQFKATLEQQERSSNLQQEFATIQIKIANEQATSAKKEFLHQDIAARRERFANRFYMMMSIHRDNVGAFDVGRPGNRHVGRRAFLPLLNELKFLYWVAVYFHDFDWVMKRKRAKLEANEIYNISYLYFFFGFGEISTPMVLDLVGDRLREFASQLHLHYDYIGKDKKYWVTTPTGKLEFDNEYDLGTGHLRRLSHYFRHLYQTVKYVDDQDPILLDYEKKYSYTSNLRAQLSAHEQLLLYYNARSVLGKPWLDYKAEKGQKEGLLTRYCMIRSIPLNTADFYETPKSFLGEVNREGKPLFEWTEIKQRIEELGKA